jgi:hypothetical protein
MSKYMIHKVGQSPQVEKSDMERPEPPRIAGRKKSMKTYPRGVLKRGGTIKAVRDPAKAPPMKQRKGTLRILTEKGASKRRQQIKHTVRNMSDFKVRETLRKAGMPINPATPTPLARDILEGGVEAGMIVVK